MRKLRETKNYKDKADEFYSMVESLSVYEKENKAFGERLRQFQIERDELKGLKIANEQQQSLLRTHLLCEISVCQNLMKQNEAAERENIEKAKEMKSKK